MSTPTKKKRRERFKELFILRPSINESQPSPSQATKVSIDQSDEIHPASENLQPVTFKNLWDLALQNFQILNKETVVQDTSGLDILKQLQEFVQAKQKLCEARKWKFEYRGRHIILRDVAQKALKWLEIFKQVGDLVSSFDPVHAALPWAGVRFVLQVFWSLYG